MIFPRKKLILPCHKNGYLQSASDARKWRDRFKRNPLAKVADMFIPRPLRMSPGYPCCCGTEGQCTHCNIPDRIQIEISGVTNLSCSSCGSLNGTYVLSFTEEVGYECKWRYTFSSSICTYTYMEFRHYVNDPRYEIAECRIIKDSTNYISWLCTENTDSNCTCENSSYVINTGAATYGSFYCNAGYATCTFTEL